MKKEKTVTINGVTFEKIKGGVNNINTSLKDIYQCYERPSIYKVNIYNEWCEYAKKVDASEYGVASYNCMMFTFDFMFSYNDIVYLAHITPRHNYIVEVL